MPEAPDGTKLSEDYWNHWPHLVDGHGTLPEVEIDDEWVITCICGWSHSSTYLSFAKSYAEYHCVMSESTLVASSEVP
jgi:hypothetical protein